MLLSLLAMIYLFYELCSPRHSDNNMPSIYNNEGHAFAGSATCASCHKDIYATHIKTAHYQDSRPATKEYIKGSFDSGRNHFVYNKAWEVILEQQDHHFFQTAILNGKENQRAPFDIVIGSARKGQSYLYWDSSRLFQLPVSYYTALDSWCNSPGFPDGYPRFNRRVPSFCLECHATYAKTIDFGESDNGYRFDKNQVIYGIDCEKCHGPGAEHVAFYTAHPGTTTTAIPATNHPAPGTNYPSSPTAAAPPYILNTRRMSRQQRLDACALCHSGARTPVRPAFSFKTGDRLNDFSLPGYLNDSAASLDVHANQYGLLTASKCFRSSQMDCASCHNVHVNEAGNLKAYSQKCMTCHNTADHNTCTVKAAPGLVLSDNCIDCHMPARPSQKIILTLSGTSKAVHDLVRTHRIAIYSITAPSPAHQK